MSSTTATTDVDVLVVGGGGAALAAAVGAAQAGARVVLVEKNQALGGCKRVGHRVRGAVVETAHARKTILVNRRVVLAVGDFSANAELKEHLLNAQTATVQGINPNQHRRRHSARTRSGLRRQRLHHYGVTAA